LIILNRDPPDLPPLTILLDNGYHLDSILKKLKVVYPEIADKVQFELSAKLSRQEKPAQRKSIFVPVIVILNGLQKWVIIPECFLELEGAVIEEISKGSFNLCKDFIFNKVLTFAVI